MKSERRVTHLPRVPIRTRATLVLESELTVAVACIRVRVPGVFLWEAGNATTLSSDDCCCCCPAKLSLLAEERDNLPLPTHPLFFFFAPQNISTAAVVWPTTAECKTAVAISTAKRWFFRYCWSAMAETWARERERERERENAAYPFFPTAPGFGFG